MPTPPPFEWDVAAWRSDSRVTALSPLARGIYRELLDSMHELDHCGVISGTREELARHGRCPVVELVQTIEELKKNDTCGVTERNGLVTLVNRRMKREHDQREKLRNRVEKHRSNRQSAIGNRPVKRSCNASGNALVTPPPHTPLLSSDKGNDKALSPLSSLKASTVARARAIGNGGARLSQALTLPQREIVQRFEIILGHQWINDAGKWVNRCKAELSKAERVVAEVESALKENRIETTPAQYAEQIWKEFK